MDSNIVDSETILDEETLAGLGKFFSKRSNDFTEYDIIVGLS